MFLNLVEVDKLILESNISVNEKINKITNKLDVDLSSEEDKILNFILSDCADQRIPYDKVFDNYNDSSKTIIKKLKNENDYSFNIFVNDLLKKISSVFPNYKKEIESLEAKEILEKLKNDFYNKFWKNSVSIKKEIKKSIKEEKKESKNYYKTLKTGYGSVNLNGINSKLIEIEIKNYVEVLKKIETEIIPIQEKIKKLQTAKSVLIGLSATFGISAGALAIASVFVPPLGIVSTAFTIASITFGTISSYIGEIINTLINKIDKIITSIKSIKNLNYDKDGIGEIISISSNIHSALQEIYTSLASTYYIKENIDAIKTASGISSIVSGFLTLVDYYKSILDIKKTIENQRKIYEGADKVKKYLSTLDNTTLIVVDESPQDKPYVEGGIGGKNLLFKNLKNSEIFTLEQLIKKNQIELNLMGVAKVYNPKLDEWYIRTFPNKFLGDNLG